MEQLVRDITTQFVNKLPKDQEFFTPEDLRGLKIPEFLIQRVELEMTRNLSDSIVPPYSEWADMSQTGIQKSWQRFIDTILEEVRMPVAHAQAVFETSVGDVVEIILQPRLAIPSIIFGTESVLEKDQIEKNARFVTINKHFPTTLLRYMEKKGKSKLSREACESIIERIDERLTKNYNPLNWTQLLEPLFILAGPSVDTNLFRLFFEDKKMNRVARRLDMLNSSLNKTQFIEELSAPDLLKEEGYEDEQSTFFEVPAGKKNVEKKPEDEKKTSADKKAENEENNEETEKPDFTFDLYSLDKIEDDQQEEPVAPTVDEQQDEEEEEADTLLTGFHNRRTATDDPKEEITEKNDEEMPLHSKFVFDDEGEEEEIIEETEPELDQPETQEDQPEIEDHQPEEKDDQGDERPIFEVFGGNNGNEDDEETTVFGDLILSEKDIPEVEKEPEKIVSEEESDEEESPIWQAFLSGEEESEADSDKMDEDGFIDDPIIDLTKDDSEEIEKLSGWLMDDKARFVEEIFGGSENAYEQSLNELVSFDNWKDASRFIEKEIFSRNMVDMYEEAAVDFTDRLHTYFKEFKSTKNHS
ncbi:MAG: hypothetical protein WEA58_05230 [Balneolaceae bacterium]